MSIQDDYHDMLMSIDRDSLKSLDNIWSWACEMEKERDVLRKELEDVKKERDDYYEEMVQSGLIS